MEDQSQYYLGDLVDFILNDNLKVYNPKSDALDMSNIKLYDKLNVSDITDTSDTPNIKHKSYVIKIPKNFVVIVRKTKTKRCSKNYSNQQIRCKLCNKKMKRSAIYYHIKKEHPKYNKEKVTNLYDYI